MAEINQIKKPSQFVAQQGWRGLMRGLSYPLFTVGAINSLFFGAYGWALEAVDGTDSPGPQAVFSAGCLAGAAQLVLATPVDLVKVRLQAQQGRYRGPGHCLASLHRAGGLAGCYRGLPAQAARDIIASGLYFLIYSQAAGPEAGPTQIFLAGGLAGLLSWQAILPLDVLKSRLQADCEMRPRYTGLADCLVQSVRQDGVRVLGRGFIMMSVRAFPLNGATFLGYEYTKKLLERLHA